jgi:hypothetical protein
MPSKMKISEDKIKEHRYFIVKCDLFDKVKVSASAQAVKAIPFAVSSTLPIKVGLGKLKASPFKTIFVIDDARDSVIFALTQNAELEAEAKKKRPPPPPPPPPDCCFDCIRAGAECIVDATSCWCIVFPDSPADMLHRTPFTADDDLASVLQIIK